LNAVFDFAGYCRLEGKAVHKCGWNTSMSLDHGLGHRIIFVFVFSAPVIVVYRYKKKTHELPSQVDVDQRLHIII
jgi:hypothetical protein